MSETTQARALANGLPWQASDADGKPAPMPPFTYTGAEGFWIYTYCLITGDMWEFHRIPMSYTSFVYDVLGAIVTAWVDVEDGGHVMMRKYILNKTPYTIALSETGGHDLRVRFLGQSPQALIDIFIAAAEMFGYGVEDVGAGLRLRKCTLQN